MRIALIALLIVGCSLSRSFEPEEIETEVEVEEPPTPPVLTPDQIEFSIAELSPAKIEVKQMHWSCCTDLCRGKPSSVTRDMNTSYIKCQCSDGRLFRVTRLKGKGR